MTINKQAGVSLVELMIVSAMLGGLSLVVMNLTKQSTKSSAKYQFDSETMQITNEIIGILSTPSKCLSTLAGMSALNTASGISSINGNQYFISTDASAPPKGYGNGGLKFVSYALSATAAEIAANTSWLAINIQNKKILGGPPTVTKKVKLKVMVDGGNLITECNAVASGGSSSQWITSGSNIYYNDGNVGIGMNSPASRLVIKGMTNNASASALDVVDSGNNSKLFVRNDGKIGIGTTSPYVPLHLATGPFFIGPSPSSWSTDGILVNAPAARSSISFLHSLSGQAQPTDGFDLALVWSSADINLRENGYMRFLTNNTEWVRITATGEMGIGTTAPGYKLDVQGGDINASGSVRAAGLVLTSDRRWKRNITPLKNSIEKMKQINGVSYDWAIDEYPEKQFSNKRQVGVIAQDVQAVYPELVLKDKQGFLSVNYLALIAPLIEVFKAQQQQIEVNVRLFQTMHGEFEEIKLMVAENKREIASNKAEIESKLKYEIVSKDKEITKLKERLNKIEQMLMKAKPEKIEKLIEKNKLSMSHT